MNSKLDRTDVAQTDLEREDVDLRLAEVLEEYLADLERGEAPDRQTLLARHPDLARQLTSCLDCLEVAQRIGTQLRDDTADGPPQADPDFPMQLGDFRILHEVGRGGMGVVYEAEQLSMGRKVALKILPLAVMMDRNGLARFKNEVRAVATLDHPNIVPIYSVGEERGVHYFAMQLIHGQSMARVIEQLRRTEPQLGASSITTAVLDSAEYSGGPRGDQDRTAVSNAPAAVEPADVSTLAARDMKTAADSKPRRSDFYRSVVELGVQAADALHHAHLHGIVHRDVKPGNLLIDGNGNLCVTDFGLARIEADAGLTLSRDWVGTLRYMAPEQALGQKARVDQRVDIYSLGATLYELLALRPAREGEDRHEMLRQFATALPTPLREVDSKIPTELTTIVGKAMEFTPADRYTTAQELADDLRHFLANEPIVARPPTRLQRIAKWAQRNRAVTWSAAVSSAAVLILAVVLLAINNVMITKERNQKDEALRDKGAALAEKEAALADKEASLIIATRVLDEISLRIVAERTLAPGTDEGSEADWWAETGHITSTRPLTDEEQYILEQVLRFYEQLAPQSDQLPQVRLHQIMANFRIGRIYGHLGRNADMLKAKQRAVAELEQLVRDHPENSDGRFLFHHFRGNLRCDQQQWNVAIDDFSRAIEIRPKSTSSWVSRAHAYSELGQNEKAVEDCSRAIELRPDNVTARYNRGAAYYKLHQWEKAIQDIDEAMALNPDFPDLWGARGEAHFGLGQFEKAIADYAHAIEREPDRSCLYNSRGRAHQELKQWDQAVADYSRAIELDPERMAAWHNRGLCALIANQFLKSVEDFSRAIELEPGNMQVLVNRAAAYKRLGQLEKAIADLSRAIELVPNVKVFLSRGDCYVEQEQWEGALSDFSRAIELAPDNARAWIWRGGVYWRMKRMEAASQDLAHAVAMRPDDANTLSLRGRLFFDLGEWANALDDYSRAVELEPDEEWHWWNLGSAHYRAGDYRSAIEALEKEIGFAGESFADSAIYLAMAHWQLGDKEIAREWYQKVVDRMTNDVARTPSLLRLRAEADALMGNGASD
jgi:tetratricopeptide (TPR) repeat protein